MILSLKHVGKYNPGFSRLHQPGDGDGTVIITMIGQNLSFLALAFITEAPGKGKVFSLTSLPSCPALLLFCQTQGLRGCCHYLVRHCHKCTTTLKCPNCEGSLVTWEGMSLISLLDCFRVFSMLLFFISILQCANPCNFYLYIFLSLVQNPNMSLGPEHRQVSLIATVNQHSRP